MCFSLGLSVIMCPGAAGRAEVSLMAYSAVVGAMSGKVTCLRCKLCPAVGGGAYHSSASKSLPVPAWLYGFPHPVIEIPLHPTSSI